jgi:pyruvate dehydrogenase E2 component (dihydrolipoamide acetyltransferase)
MSLETEIKNLTAAVVALTAKLESNNVAPAAPVVQAPAPVAAPAPAPVAAPAPVEAPAPVAAAPVMPAAPTFVAPAAPAPAASGAPFSDPKGLIDYVMGAYKALGATKGAQIQNVLVGLGYQNINDVKPEHYGQLFAGVEALKA